MDLVICYYIEEFDSFCLIIINFKLFLIHKL